MHLYSRRITKVEKSYRGNECLWMEEGQVKGLMVSFVQDRVGGLESELDPFRK